MPHFQATVRSPWTAERTFEYLADLEHFAEWDPGTVKSERIPATRPGAPPEWDVTVRTFGRELTLRYEIVQYAAPRHLRAAAETKALLLVDDITVAPDGDGCIVTYDASLTLRGPLRLFDPLFAPGFRRTVEKGAAGLTSVLEGVRA
jgi:hypothetical protein